MTKKDYNLIAKVFKEAITDIGAEDNGANVALRMLASRLGACLSLDNPRFDRQKFLVAAGINLTTESFQKEGKQVLKPLDPQELGEAYDPEADAANRDQINEEMAHWNDSDFIPREQDRPL